MLRDVAIRVSRDVGPAVVGFLRPQIVLPQWLLQAPDAHLACVLAHEREHIAARDPQLLLASLTFICIMPWNLPLWWMVQRLRRAIEIDCDARVLRDGRDAVAYGSLLLDINQREPALGLTAVALTAPRSFLETRIRIMLEARSRRWRWSAAALLTACLSCIVLSAQVMPPNSSALVPAARVTSDVLQRLAGYYHFGGLSMLALASTTSITTIAISVAPSTLDQAMAGTPSCNECDEPSGQRLAVRLRAA